MTSLALDDPAHDALRVRSLLPAVRKSFYSSALSVAVFSLLLFRFSPVGLLVWIALRIVVTAGCLYVLTRLDSKEVGSAAATRGVAILMAISGIVWGLIPLFVRPEAPEWRAVVVLWLFGNQSVITAVCSPSRPVFASAIGSVTVVGAAMTAVPGEGFAYTLAAVLLLGGLYSLSIFQALNRLVDSAISGELRAASLASSLKERQGELEAVNTALDHLASVDSLTGLANRRAFEGSVSMMTAACSRPDGSAA